MGNSFIERGTLYAEVSKVSKSMVVDFSVLGEPANRRVPTYDEETVTVISS